MAGREPFPSVEARNRALHNLAAADTAHDFGDSGRLQEDIKTDKSYVPRVFHTLWSQGKREIGTLEIPTHLTLEDAIFEQYTGLSIADIQGAPDDDQELTMMTTDGIPSLAYTWRTIPVAKKVEGEYQYENSRNLFDKLTGGAETLYFTIDAVVTKIHDALVATQAATAAAVGQRRAFYLKTREGTNDAAGKVDLTADTLRRGQTGVVTLEVIEDNYEEPVAYPAMKVGSTEPAALFDSVFGLSMTGGRTKEGIRSAALTFTRGTKVMRTVKSQTGGGLALNTVNAIYGYLMRLAKDFMRPGAGATSWDTKRDEYFAYLQQKRSGDWLQVLATFQPERFPGVPAGAPIYIASEDRLCVLYALCVGAPVIYTFVVGNEYYATVFRPKREGVDEKAALHGQITTKLGGQRAEEYEVFPGLGYRALVNAYRELYPAAMAELLGRLLGSLNSLEGILGNRQTGRFTPWFRSVFTTYAVILEFVCALPPIKGLEKGVRLLDEPVTAENYDKVKRQYVHFWDTVNAFRSAFRAEDLVAADATAAITAGLRATIARAEAAVAKARPFATFDLEKPFYNTPYINTLQNFQTYLTAPVGDFANARAPLQGFLQAVLAQLEKDLAEATDPTIRRRLRPMIMNCRVFLYLIIDDVTELPLASIPSLKAFLKSIRGGAPAKGFALSRLFAKLIRQSVDTREREKAVAQFVQIYSKQGGARTVAMVRRKAGLTGTRKGRISPINMKGTLRSGPKSISMSVPRSRSGAKAFATPLRAVTVDEYAMRTPFLVLAGYINMLYEIWSDLAEGPQRNAAVALAAYLGPLVQPGAAAAFWDAWVPAIPALPYLEFLYYEAIVDILTAVLPMQTEGPAITAAPISDTAELTTTLNTLLFGSGTLDRPPSEQAEFFTRNITAAVIKYRAAQPPIVTEPTPDSLIACVDNYEAGIAPLPEIVSLALTPKRSLMSRLRAAKKSIRRISKSARRYVDWKRYRKFRATLKATRSRARAPPIGTIGEIDEEGL